MTMSSGAVQAVSKKQKVVTRISTEAELIGGDDIIAQIVWTGLFLEAQGYTIRENIVYRNNMSSMKLEKNGLASAGKHS